MVLFALSLQGNDDITSVSTILAFMKGQLSGSHNLAKGLEKAVKRFMMARLRPFRGWRGPRASLNRALMKKFCRSVETWYELGHIEHGWEQLQLQASHVNLVLPNF